MAENSEPDMLHVHQMVNRVMDILLPLDPTTRKKVLGVVGSYFGSAQQHPQAVASSDARKPRDPHFTTQEPPTPKDFLHQKQPTNDLQRVACLAYYLDHYRDSPHFKTIDISKLNTEAAQVKFANAPSTVRNATAADYLTTATKGMKQLTAAGEKFVEALPDQAAAKEAISKARPRRVRRKVASKAQGRNSGE